MRAWFSGMTGREVGGVTLPPCFRPQIQRVIGEEDVERFKRELADEAGGEAADDDEEEDDMVESGECAS